MQINKRYVLLAAICCLFIVIVYIVAKVRTTSSFPSDFKDYNKKARLKRETIALNLEPILLINGRKQKKYSIYELMKFLKIPGVSIAVFRDGHIDYQATYGYADQSNHRQLTINTLFQAASISKPITAVTLISSGYDLNADIRPKLQLLGLDDLYANYPDSAITAKQLLSHTAGFNVPGFAGYTDDKLPSINQILNAVKPANNEAIRVISKPGEKYNYSGGGYTLIELLLQLHKNQLFSEQAQQIFNKLRMTHSSYDVNKLLGNISYGHNHFGKKMKNHYNRYPEKAAAGLWTTPLDLSLFALDIMAGLNKNSSKVLAKDQIIEMLTNQTLESSTTGYALGFVVETADNNIKTFGHSGINNGFQSNMLADVNNGAGFVIMTNGDNGMLLANIIANTISKVYGLSSYKSAQEITFNNKIDPLYLREYKLSYNAEPLKLFMDGDELKVKLPMPNGAVYTLNLYQIADKIYKNDWIDAVQVTLDKNPEGEPTVKIFDEVASIR